MKKILSILALVALVAVFATSCSKSCKCYEDGEMYFDYGSTLTKSQCKNAESAGCKWD